MTRPEEDAGAAANALHALGHDVHRAPLMEIMLDAPRPLNLDGVQAFLATSANGVRALVHQRADAPRLGLPILCVGDATARTAREHGFQMVHSAGGDVESLAGLVRTTLSPAAGRLIHVAGKARAGNLATFLQPDGFTVTIEQLYRAEPVSPLGEDTVSALKDGDLDAVLLYSPRSARLFVEQIAAGKLEDEARALEYFCLSQAVTRELEPLHIDAMHLNVASEPTQAALFNLLEKKPHNR